MIRIFIFLMCISLFLGCVGEVQRGTFKDKRYFSDDLGFYFYGSMEDKVYFDPDSKILIEYIIPYEYVSKETEHRFLRDSFEIDSDKFKSDIKEIQLDDFKEKIRVIHFDNKDVLYYLKYK